jgi:hypothetical protein
MAFQELTRRDNIKIARWLNLPLQEFLDMGIPLSTDDLICAGVVIKGDNEDEDED